MNKENKLIVAQKYAKAYVNVYMAKMVYEDIDKIKKLISYLKQYNDAFIYIKLPFIDNNVKKDVFYKLLSEFGLVEQLKKLVDLLIEHNRTQFLYYVLNYIINFYKDKLNILDFTIVSSHELDDNKIDQIIKFLEISTNKKIVYELKIDKSLISGLKIYNDNYSLDLSIRKQLNLLNHTI